MLCRSHVGHAVDRDWSGDWRRDYLVAEAGSEERDGAGGGGHAVGDWRIAGGRGV